MKYGVSLCWHDPFEDNDCQAMGEDYETREEAERLYADLSLMSGNAWWRCATRECPWVALFEDGRLIKCRCHNEELRKRREAEEAEQDDLWRRETAQIAGMTFGANAYNDSMGWGSEES